MPEQVFVMYKRDSLEAIKWFYLLIFTGIKEQINFPPPHPAIIMPERIHIFD